MSIELKQAAQHAADELEDCANLLRLFEAPADSCVGASAKRASNAAESLRTAIQQAEAKTDELASKRDEILAWLRKEAEKEDYFGRKHIAEKLDGAANLIERTHPEPGVPFEAISGLLADAITQAAANGANSISMPDEYVEIAKWIYAAQAQKGQP